MSTPSTRAVARKAKRLSDSPYVPGSDPKPVYRELSKLLGEALTEKPADPVLLTCWRRFFRIAGNIEKRSRSCASFKKAATLQAHPDTWQAYFDPHGT